MASETAVRLHLSNGDWCIPLKNLHAVSALAALTGDREDYFLGWLSFHGQDVPVFDLNFVVCEEPALARYGSRVLVVRVEGSMPARFLGLLADGVTDTVSATEFPLLDLRAYLPMLETLTPGVAPA